MDRWQALYAFWSQFGLDVYDQMTVPTGDAAPDPPYITYEAAVGSSSTDIYLTAALWYRGYGWTDITAKAEAIHDAIGERGTRIKCDTGELWIRRAQPFARRDSDPTDDSIRRMNLMIYVRFETI